MKERVRVWEKRKKQGLFSRPWKERDGERTICNQTFIYSTNKGLDYSEEEKKR